MDSSARPGDSSRFRLASLAALMLVHTALLAWSAWQHSPTNDEIAYLPAGISHWQFGRFELAAVNPPLTRLLAAIPVLFASPKTDWANDERRHEPTFAHLVGHDFVMANGSRSPWLFTLARWACIPLSLFGLWICYRWAQELYGGLAGLVSGALWCFCPNILAHAQVITPDVGGATFAVCAAYTFWRWTRMMNWPRAILAGLALGIAQLARTTLVILFPLWVLITFVDVATNARRDGKSTWRRTTSQLLAIYAIALFVLNDGYLFSGTGRRLGDFRFISRSLAGAAAEQADAGNRFEGSLLNEVPVPLPADYVLGIDAQKRQFEMPWTSRSYLRGHWRDGGWWYYYLYGFTVKVPIGTLVLLVIASASCVINRSVQSDWRSTLCILLPPLIILAVVSSQTGFSRHFRYVLSSFPFLFVWISQIAAARRTLGFWFRHIAMIAGLASVASSLWTYPHSLSYFNEIVGGPMGGHGHLLSSNISWGQDLLYLQRWLAARPEACPFDLAFAADFPPGAIGINYPPPPPGPDGHEADINGQRSFAPGPGWYAVSVDYLRGDRYPRNAQCEYFLRLHPTATAGYSLYIYHLENTGSQTRGPAPAN